MTTLNAEPPRGASHLEASSRPASWTERDGIITAGAGDWTIHELPANGRIHFEYALGADGGGGEMRLNDEVRVPLDGAPGEWQAIDVAAENVPGGPGVVRVWKNAQEIQRLASPARPLDASGARFVSTAEQARDTLRWDGDFTVVVRFRTSEGGTLVSMAPAEGAWAPNAKALFIREGRMVYDIGWLGAYAAGPEVNDGAWHTVALVVSDGTANLHLDGASFGPRAEFSRPDVPNHILKIGTASPDFGGDFRGEIDFVRYYQRALTPAEAQRLTGGAAASWNTPDFDWHPDQRATDAPALRLSAPAGTHFRNLWSQPLERTDHAGLIAAWGEESLARGAAIYAQMCVICHGTRESPGSLPTALRFGEAPFKNGGDPFSMFLTLAHGFGQMVAQPQYTARQKYDVIHYIRETFLTADPSLSAPPDADYLARLPIGLATAEAETESEAVPPYRKMDFGPLMMWTIEVEQGNIAQKGLAIRLDPGNGGISQGNTWMLYDHDTLRVAAGWSGEGFVDWRGIAFDGSHQSHTRLVGDPTFINPPGPGWANPTDGSWSDPRPRDRDGQPYGPLPASWAKYRGVYRHGSAVVLGYSVGSASVLDSPSLIAYGTAPVFVRTLNVGPASTPLTVRLAPDDPKLAATLAGEGAQLAREDGFLVLHFPAATTPRHVRVHLAQLDAANLAALADAHPDPLDLSPLTAGGPPMWDQTIIMQVNAGSPGGAFNVDELSLPDSNPWHSWMRTTGFDFYPDGKSAAVCTWNGDVWRVDGIDGAGDLRWRRLAAGLFQPLGVKFRDGELFVACRDQIARLRDLNDDGETDFVECFNNDHQVTEHFHEFAMGLQTDAAGNFYYAKSARHALPALVPHHGTLLRVSADGARTDILAHGFRAANGVCLNDDGSFFVTDQEGHWTPKNRINHVLPDGGFYGNIFGYTEVTDTSDEAMRPPMVWVTNEMDRSPAELVRVPENAWGSLAGSLLNLSYGYGRIFLVPHESVAGQRQGGVVALPIPDFPTGLMRGRFHPQGALYACGMVGWATNCRQDGGFYRIRRTTLPAALPVGLSSRPGALSLTFSDPVSPELGRDDFAVKVWDLRRSANYGSPHLRERPLPVETVRLGPDGRTVTLALPGLAPTQGMEITWRFPSAVGGETTGSLHLSLHALGQAADASDPADAPPPAR